MVQNLNLNVDLDSQKLHILVLSLGCFFFFPIFCHKETISFFVLHISAT